MEGRTRLCKGAVMRSLNRNKQKMFYAYQTGEKPLYELDENGNIIYDDIDGELTPRETGETLPEYSEPVEFWGNIAYKGGQEFSESFGVDLSDYDAVLYAPEIELEETALIWYRSDLEDTADYKVVRVPPCLDERVYLLEGLA